MPAVLLIRVFWQPICVSGNQAMMERQDMITDLLVAGGVQCPPRSTCGACGGPLPADAAADLPVGAGPAVDSLTTMDFAGAAAAVAVGGFNGNGCCSSGSSGGTAAVAGTAAVCVVREVGGGGGVGRYAGSEYQPCGDAGGVVVGKTGTMPVVDRSSRKEVARRGYDDTGALVSGDYLGAGGGCDMRGRGRTNGKGGTNGSRRQ